MAELQSHKVQDVSTRLAKKHGNGILRREVWVDGKGKVEAVEFLSFENIEDRFEADWTAFRRRGKK